MPLALVDAVGVQVVTLMSSLTMGMGQQSSGNAFSTDSSAAQEL